MATLGRQSKTAVKPVGARWNLPPHETKFTVEARIFTQLEKKYLHKILKWVYTVLINFRKEQPNMSTMISTAAKQYFYWFFIQRTGKELFELR